MVLLKHVEKSCALLCVRSTVLKKQLSYYVFAYTCWLLISCIVCSLKKYCSMWLRIVFVHINSPNPYIKRCKCLPYQKQYTLLTFMKNPSEIKTAIAIRGAEHRERFTLCVCFCVSPSSNLHETLIGLRPLWGKYENVTCTRKMCKKLVTLLQGRYKN